MFQTHLGTLIGELSKRWCNVRVNLPRRRPTSVPLVVSDVIQQVWVVCVTPHVEHGRGQNHRTTIDIPSFSPRELQTVATTTRSTAPACPSSNQQSMHRLFRAISQISRYTRDAGFSPWIMVNAKAEMPNTHVGMVIAYRKSLTRRQQNIMLCTGPFSPNSAHS